nr:putative reverse transcriptase domain-containing protein [Tanacetum cinerariifolium]
MSSSNSNSIKMTFNPNTHDLELGAVVFALEIWRHYLYGTKCTVFTDYKSLQHILDDKELNMRQHHWLELLSNYDCEIRSHPGKANTKARKPKNFEAEDVGGMIRKEKLEPCVDGTLCLKNMSWFPCFDCLTKSAYFLLMKENDTIERLTRLYMKEVIRRHEIPVSIICDRDGRIQSALDRHKSYADVRRKPLEFQVGDKVMLKVLPWKEVIYFGKRGKLNPRYIGPFKVLEKVGTVAYRLELLQQLSRVRSTFHDEEEVSYADNNVTEVKALMALTDKEIVFVGKESARNGIDQLTKDTSSCGPKYLVFVKSSSDNSEVFIIGRNKPKLSKAKDSTLSNHDTGKNVKMEDDPLLAIIMKELNKLKLQISKNKSSYLKKILNRIISLRRGIKPRNPQHFIKNYETCSSNVHTTSNHNDIEWFRKKEALLAKKV